MAEKKTESIFEKMAKVVGGMGSTNAKDAPPQEELAKLNNKEATETALTEEEEKRRKELQDQIAAAAKEGAATKEMKK